MDNNNTGQNLRKYRKQKGWSQEELAVAAALAYNETITDTRKRKEKYNSATISQWERGHKAISIKMINILSQALGITPEDLTGGPTSEIKTLERGKKIELKDINNYNMKPIYINRKDNRYPFQPAIVNAEMGCVVLGTTQVIDYDELADYNLFSAALYGTIMEDMAYRDTLSLKEVMESKRVWVQLIDYKSYYLTRNKGRYNGWFTHNETHTALVNEIGCVLSYDKLGDIYNAYKYNPVYSN